MSTNVPAEWAPHKAMWLGFPSHEEVWEDNLAPAQAEVAALARALAGPGRERVRLMTGCEAGEAVARQMLGDVPGIEIFAGRFGDVWLRDTGPIFAPATDGNSVAHGFGFNGWGGKYVMDHDEKVAEQIATASATPLVRHDLIMEGGSLDHDGLGTLLTTKECLLNPNRNGDMTMDRAEAALAEALGSTKVIWLGEGLRNDHTDGHIDNLARFVAPGVVVCPMGFGRGDVNVDAYDEAARILANSTDATGRPLKLVRIPSPGWIEGHDGRVAPASHMNFIIANGAVVVPTYSQGQAAALAVEALSGLFPDRQIIPLPSNALLSGGGSFHCITQQEPA
jgi:agmatine deiminase